MQYESTKATKPPTTIDGETTVVPFGVGAGDMSIPGMLGSIAAVIATMATKQKTKTVTGDRKAAIVILWWLRFTVLYVYVEDCGM